MVVIITIREYRIFTFSHNFSIHWQAVLDTLTLLSTILWAKLVPSSPKSPSYGDRKDIRTKGKFNVSLQLEGKNFGTKKSPSTKDT